MQILHQAKWFGLSLALHLVIAATLIAGMSRYREHKPKVIMVVLDNLDLPERQPAKVFPVPPKALVRPVSRVAPQPDAPSLKQELQPQTAVQRSAEAGPAQEEKRARVLPGASTSAAPQIPAAYASQPPRSSDDSLSAAERAQQRYLKEHFSYIRDLITRRLVYPPMARRMNWSGRVHVSFVIAEDGSVHGLRVAKSSGFSMLDKSALEAVRNTAPFPRPPVRAEIVVPVNFSLVQ